MVHVGMGCADNMSKAHGDRKFPISSALAGWERAGGSFYGYSVEENSECNGADGDGC
jgi:hypothetical protein